MNFGTTLGIAFLELLMGMRHATDADHVIAVTTIVSRERRLITASRIGIVWGFGHTLTVLAVSFAIIVFKIAIPIRLALAASMIAQSRSRFITITAWRRRRCRRSRYDARCCAPLASAWRTGSRVAPP